MQLDYEKSIHNNRELHRHLSSGQKIQAEIFLYPRFFRQCEPEGPQNNRFGSILRIYLELSISTNE